MTMSKETCDDGKANHDYLEEDVDMDDLVIPSSNINNIRSEADSDASEDNAKPLHVQIA